MDATNFNNDKLEVAEKFECNVKTPQNKNYLITKTENKTAEKFECNLSRAMSVASRTQTPQNKNYLVTKTENKTAEKFECNLSRVMSVASNTRTPQNKNYLVTKTEKKTAEKFEDNLNRVMSRTQSPQTKNYLAKKSGGGIQKRAFVPTVPKPFKFYTELRASKSRNKENSPKSPLLENPTRFDAKSGKVRSNTLTVPKSPYLRIKDRSKPTTILPTEEREIPKVQKPKLTEPYSPVITKPKTLHAQSLLNFEPEIHRKPECPPPTEPIGFSDNRIEERHIYGEHKRFREKEVEEQRIAKIRKEEPLHAQPLLNFEPEIPRKPECPLPTEPIGFSDTRMEERHISNEHRRFREKETEEQRILKIREEEPFHAQPLLNFEPEIPRKPECPPPTEPIGFSDTMEERHISDEHRRFREKEAEEQRISKIREEEPFHAQPLLNFEPEIPRKPECPPPTEPIGFSDTMEERHISDEHRRFREKEADEQRISKIREEEVRNAINIQPLARPISPMIGEKYMKLLNNYEYSFRDSLFDLDNIDNINDPILHLYQITGVYALTPIYECETTE
ncbi:unnamed protein product [Rhizophagus irregularis]|nr:unnamed protein product [Rhizophagus irregularis]